MTLLTWLARKLSSCVSVPRCSKRACPCWHSGVIVGAGVAAAVVGVLAGYAAYRRRVGTQATAAASALSASPAKLRSFYTNDVAVLASASRRTSLSPLGRRSAARSQAGLGGISVAFSSSTASDATQEDGQVRDGIMVHVIFCPWENGVHHAGHECMNNRVHFLLLCCNAPAAPAGCRCSAAPAAASSLSACPARPC